jgi:putative ABC transport system permease protein
MENRKPETGQWEDQMAGVIPLRYNLRSLAVRRTTSIMTALGVALVVMVLVLLLGLIDGLRQTMLLAGTPGNWIILSRGVASEPSSYIGREAYLIIRTRPEITADGDAALLSPELVTGFDPDPERPSTQTFVRGVYPIAYRVHSHMRLVNGRWPEPSQSEMVVGQKLAARYPALTPPTQLRFGRRTWTIVGMFSDDGSARESEVWTDVETLQEDVRYTQGFSSLHVVLTPGQEASFTHVLENDSRLRMDTVSEADFYVEQARLADQLRGLTLLIAGLLAVGASFGAANTMYAAVARRTREVGVLRALGYGRGTVLMSFIIESILLALAGGLTGELLAVVVAHLAGLDSRLMEVGMFIFSFRLSPRVCLAGLIMAVLIGALSGIMPAWRAARLPVVDALREA